MVLITTQGQGVTLDLANIPNDKTLNPIKMFTPKSNVNIYRVSLYTDRVEIQSSFGKYSLRNDVSEITDDTNMSAYPITSIDETAIESLEHLYDMLITVI